MDILRLKPGQTIRINESTSLTVLRIEGTQVRLGITASDNSTIRRLNDSLKENHLADRNNDSPFSITRE